MSFLAHEENGLFIKTSTVLSDVRHGFSTRIGGVSPAPWDSLNLGVGRGDDMDRVRENYRRFCAALGVDEHRAVLSKQVHEDNVRHVTAEDCGIILLHDPVHGAVGAAHAGWRGAACGIVYKTVRRMQELFGTDPGDLRAAIGAAIGPCCFETDADVPQALEAALGAEAEPYITRRGPKWHVDLKGVNARWLEKAGVRQIDVSPDCTACHPDLYWSHRRMGQARGAQIAMICL